MCISNAKISRSLGIGCLMCCMSKVVMLAAGASVVSLNQGLLPGILCSFALGLLGIAYYRIETREAQAKLCPIKV
jgi:hypothetical protein